MYYPIGLINPTALISLYPDVILFTLMVIKGGDKVDRCGAIRSPLGIWFFKFSISVAQQHLSTNFI
jgi:hypothetical protein